MKNQIFKTILFFAVIYLFNNVNIFSQTQILNGNFEGFNSIFSGGDCDQNTDPSFITTATAPFQSCNSAGINDWWVSHGTPELFRDFGPNHVAVMWTGKWRNDGVLDYKVRGEGIFITCNTIFEGNKSYHLNIKLGAGSQPVQHAYIVLTNYISGLYPVYYPPLGYYSIQSGLYDIPQIPANSQIIADMSLSAGSFQTYNLSFVSDNDYNILWIFPYSDVHDPIAVLWVDNVIFGECLANITYQNTSVLPSLTIRQDYIKTLNSVVVQSTQNVTFNAGNYVELNPGFETQDGCFFEALIQGCVQTDFSNCASGNTKNELKTFVTLNIKNNQEYINCFPNPVNDIINFNYSLYEDAILHIYSFTGQELIRYNITNTANTINIPVTELKEGMYIYKVITNSKTIFSDKFIIIR